VGSGSFPRMEEPLETEKKIAVTWKRPRVGVGGVLRERGEVGKFHGLKHDPPSEFGGGKKNSAGFPSPRERAGGFHGRDRVLRAPVNFGQKGGWKIFVVSVVVRGKCLLEDFVSKKVDDKKESGKGCGALWEEPASGNLLSKSQTSPSEGKGTGGRACPVSSICFRGGKTLDDVQVRGRIV